MNDYVRDRHGELYRVVMVSHLLVSMRHYDTGRVHWASPEWIAETYTQMEETAPGIFQPAPDAL